MQQAKPISFQTILKFYQTLELQNGYPAETQSR
jgi:hypothetical protein